MSSLFFACSDDNVVNEDGIGGTENLPNTRVTITTTAEGSELDVTEVTKTKDDVTYVPDGYNISGSFTGVTNALYISVSDLATGAPTTYVMSAYFQVENVTEGTYNLNSQNLLSSVYRNNDISQMQYTVRTGTMTLTKVQEISVNGLGTYYCKGTMELEYENMEADPSNLTVKVDFEGVPVSFSNIPAKK